MLKGFYQAGVPGESEPWATATLWGSCPGDLHQARPKGHSCVGAEQLYRGVRVQIKLTSNHLWRTCFLMWMVHIAVIFSKSDNKMKIWWFENDSISNKLSAWSTRTRSTCKYMKYSVNCTCDHLNQFKVHWLFKLFLFFSERRENYPHALWRVCRSRSTSFGCAVCVNTALWSRRSVNITAARCATVLWCEALPPQFPRRISFQTQKEVSKRFNTYSLYIFFIYEFICGTREQKMIHSWKQLLVSC